MSLIEQSTRFARRLIDALTFASPALDLLIRLWVANVFWKSGLTKIASWDSTLTLFTYEFQVPLLPPEVAAPLAAGIELTFPVLLVLGLGARLSALALFLFNLMAVISYPGLSEVGLRDHTYWGLLLLVTLLHGPGKISIDHFIRRKFLGTTKR
ncbi:MAG: DoxX family protein [Thiobacillus sp.]|nr:DoxX family protein [Thiobacillus sp.]